jgi:hypothetical protein
MCVCWWWAFALIGIGENKFHQYLYYITSFGRSVKDPKCSFILRRRKIHWLLRAVKSARDARRGMIHEATSGWRKRRFSNTIDKLLGWEDFPSPYQPTCQDSYPENYDTTLFCKKILRFTSFKITTCDFSSPLPLLWRIHGGHCGGLEHLEAKKRPCLRLPWRVPLHGYSQMYWRCQALGLQMFHPGLLLYSKFLV